MKRTELKIEMVKLIRNLKNSLSVGREERRWEGGGGLGLLQKDGGRWAWGEGCGSKPFSLGCTLLIKAAFRKHCILFSLGHLDFNKVHYFRNLVHLFI